MDEGRTFEEARRVLRQHYQHIVIHDFLKRRVADPAIVEDIVQYGNRWYNAAAEPFFMPFEFAVAAYRFGHTMVRARFNFNLNFNIPDNNPATLEKLFTFTALSGEIGGLETVPDNWIIEWENIIGDGPTVGKARRLDTLLAAIGGKALFNLQTLDGKTETGLAAFLSARTCSGATGCACRRARRSPTSSACRYSHPRSCRRQPGTRSRRRRLVDGGFLDRTPLWFYLLAEAKHHGGTRLGPVGSTIVAEVLIGLVRRSDDSILRTPGWVPSLPSATPGRFELADLLRFAGVLPGGAPTPSYVVQPGDTLFSIARDRLGDGNRWPEIFALNGDLISNPDVIVVGQVLRLPTT